MAATTSTETVHGGELADEALDRSGGSVPGPKYCVGPRPKPNPWRV